MATIAVYDACVLYPAPLRDLLIRMAAAGVVRAYWTEDILDECFAAILKRRPDLNEESLARTRLLLKQALPESLVTGYEKLISSLTLPDPKDRHVLAAAITCRAKVIVTMNLRDFPHQALNGFSITPVHPDEFIAQAVQSLPEAMVSIVNQQAAALHRPPITVDELLNKLESCGLKHAMACVRKVL